MPNKALPLVSVPLDYAGQEELRDGGG